MRLQNTIKVILCLSLGQSDEPSSTEKREDLDPVVGMDSDYFKRQHRFCCGLFSVSREKMANIAPVAWMILLGDGFHNLMDGLTIGAGFTISYSVGITLTLSILFEELPHELGEHFVLY